MFYTAILRETETDRIVTLRTTASPDNTMAWVEIQKKAKVDTELIAIVRGDHFVYSKNTRHVPWR